jgi:hypothetical protein
MKQVFAVHPFAGDCLLSPTGPSYISLPSCAETIFVVGATEPIESTKAFQAYSWSLDTQMKNIM